MSRMVVQRESFSLRATKPTPSHLPQGVVVFKNCCKAWLEWCWTSLEVSNGHSAHGVQKELGVVHVLVVVVVVLLLLVRVERCRGR